jgi:hypothetical protein
MSVTGESVKQETRIKALLSAIFHLGQKNLTTGPLAPATGKGLISLNGRTGYGAATARGESGAWSRSTILRKSCKV